jgi:hypothetical protein
MKHSCLLAGSYLLLLLGGCGGSSNAVDSLDSLGSKLDAAGFTCEGLEADSDELFVSEGGSCETSEGETLSVYVFNDETNRDQYLEIARTVGGGPYVIGSNWLVETPDQAMADEIAEELGATTD